MIYWAIMHDLFSLPKYIQDFLNKNTSTFIAHKAFL